MNELLSIFKALSDRNRLRIVSALLSRGSMCACQLIELIQVSGATLSRHMGVLVSSGLVASSKDGRWVHYRVSLRSTEADVLIGWIQARLGGDPQVSRDQGRLKGIMSQDPEDICRKHRGIECCPEGRTADGGNAHG